MPGKLWPTLFGEKKVIQYIWRSSWLEPKPAAAAGTLLIAVVILLAAVVSIFSYQSQNAKIAAPNTNTASSEAVGVREIQEQNVSLQSGLSPEPQTSLAPVENEIEPGLPLIPKKTQAEKTELRKNLLTKSPAVEFGWQYSATYQDWRFYPGVDLSAPDAKIAALEAGKVEKVITDSDFGLTVVVLAGQYKIHYAFLRSTPLEKGDTIFAGDTIGYVGGGNRLHLRVESLATGKYLNPLEVFI